MTFKSTLKGAAFGLMGLAGLSLAGTATAQDEPIKWDMASAFGSSLTQLGTLGVHLAENLGRVSGGNMEFEFAEPGALVPALEMFDGIASGALDSAWSTPGYWYGKEPSLALYAAVPFGPSAGEYLAWMYHGGGHDLMDEVYARHGIKSVLCGIIAPEASGWFRNEITSIEDLAGLKMRFFGLGAKVMERLGVSTQLLAGGDIYPALERGTIDATEFSMPAIDLNLGFYQIAKHYYFPGWHQQSTLFELMMNGAAYEALSDTQKAQIDITCRANITDGLAEGEAIQAAALIELQGHGVEIHRWSPEILGQIEAAWDAVAAEEAANDAHFAKTWESLEAFRTDYAIWADLGYLD